MVRKALSVAFVAFVALGTAVAVAITVSCCCTTAVRTVSGFVSRAATSAAVVLVPLVDRSRSAMSIAAPFVLTSVITPLRVVVSTVVLTLKSEV